MKTILLLMVTTLICLATVPADARNRFRTDDELSLSARSAFEEILDLWRAERYDDLYARTQPKGRVAKEDFAARLANATFKPACCWQKLQDVSVQIENSNFAAIHAKVGLEGDGDIKYKTRSYRLVRDNDLWRISQTDLMNLAGAKKAKKHRK